MPKIAVSEGDPAPGRPEGRFLQFTSLVYPNHRGVAFVARLSPIRGSITAANDAGLWAYDSLGQLRLVVCEGQTVETNAGGKTINKNRACQSMGGPELSKDDAKKVGFDTA